VDYARRKINLRHYTHNLLLKTEFLTVCQQKNVNPYNMDDFCRGREEVSFGCFLKRFVPAIVAKNKFKYRLYSPREQAIPMCTVSDEAFTLLLLENNYDRWTDIYKNRLEEPTVVETDDNATMEKRKRKWESDVSPKYTDGGIIYTDKRKMTHRGWNEEGICRFNALCMLVQKDRTKNPGVVEDLVRNWKEGMHQSKKQDDNQAVQIGIEAYHELWDDEPNNAQV
jgi:hypothetical protein